MKNLTFGLASLIIGSLLLGSCTSNNDVLSNFSKRKYLKNFKETKKNIDHSLGENTAQIEPISPKSEIPSLLMTENESKALKTTNFQPIQLNVETFAKIESKNTQKEVKQQLKQVEQEYKNLDKFNRSAEQDFLVSKEQYQFSNHSMNSAEVNAVVLVILSIFLPPLAVFLYEDAVTGNFWLDLILTLLFWLPGIIYAILVVFGGVSI